LLFDLNSLQTVKSMRRSFGEHLSFDKPVQADWIKYILSMPI